MKNTIKKILSPVFYCLHNRRLGARMEVDFWDKWLSTRGGTWHSDYLARLSSDSEVIGHHRDVLDIIYKDGLKILDVGSGPITGIYSNYNKNRLDITACDALGDAYKSLMNKHGIRPRVETIHVKGEELTRRFAERFDWINNDNSLDHSERPDLVVDQMLCLLKEDGILSLRHEINEGKEEGYRGFHKWNMAPLGDDSFHIYNWGNDFVFMKNHKGFKLECLVRERHLLCLFYGPLFAKQTILKH